MKYKKIILYVLFFMVALLFFMLIGIKYELYKNMSHTKIFSGIKGKENLNLTVVNYDKDNKKVSILAVIEDDYGINSIKYPNGDILYCNSKNKIGIDFETAINTDNIFEIENNNKEKYEKNICVYYFAPSVPEITAFPQTEGNIVKNGRNVTILAESTDEDENDVITYI